MNCSPKAFRTSAPNRGSMLAFAATPHAVDALIAAGASPDAKDRWGATPIDTFSRLGADGRALVDRLVLHAVALEPRHVARLGDLKGLATLAEFRTDIASDPVVMMAAVERRHTELVRWLLERGGSANARALDGARQSALHAAAWNGDQEMVELLVAAGADLARPRGAAQEHARRMGARFGPAHRQCGLRRGGRLAGGARGRLKRVGNRAALI